VKVSSLEINDCNDIGSALSSASSASPYIGGSGGMDRNVQDATQEDSAQMEGSAFQPAVHSTPGAGSESASQGDPTQGQDHYVPFQAMPGLMGRQNLMQAPPGFQGWAYPWLPSAPQAPLELAPQTPRGHTLQPRQVNVPTFDGTTAWEEFHTQFEIVKTFCQWTPTESAVHLATSLRGDAVRTLEALDPADRCHYPSLVETLTRRYGRAGQRDLSRIQLRGLRQGKQQSLQELAQAVVTLCRRAYPALPAETRDELSRDHFLDALLDPDVRWRVSQSRPATLDAALHNALEMEVINETERQRSGTRNLRAIGATPEESVAVVRTDLEQLQKGITDALTQGFAALQVQLSNAQERQPCRYTSGQGGDQEREGDRDNDRRHRCYKCDSPDPLKRDCPLRKDSEN